MKRPRFCFSWFLAFHKQAYICTRVHRMSVYIISFVTRLSFNKISHNCSSLSASSPQCVHTRLTALCPGLPRWAGIRKVKPVRILLKQETVSGSGISWAICKSAPRSRQITTPAPNRSAVRTTEIFTIFPVDCPAKSPFSLALSHNLCMRKYTPSRLHAVWDL